MHGGEMVSRWGKAAITMQAASVSKGLLTRWRRCEKSSTTMKGIDIAAVKATSRRLRLGAWTRLT